MRNKCELFLNTILKGFIFHFIFLPFAHIKPVPCDPGSWSKPRLKLKTASPERKTEVRSRKGCMHLYSDLGQEVITSLTSRMWPCSTCPSLLLHMHLCCTYMLTLIPYNPFKKCIPNLLSDFLFPALATDSFPQCTSTSNCTVHQETICKLK